MVEKIPTDHSLYELAESVNKDYFFPVSDVMGDPHQAVCCGYHVSSGVAERRLTKEKENLALSTNPQLSENYS